MWERYVEEIDTLDIIHWWKITQLQASTVKVPFILNIYSYTVLVYKRNNVIAEEQ